MAPIEGSHTPSPLRLTADAGLGKSSSIVKHETFDAPETVTVTSGSFGISFTYERK
jgi:hypothetical protein